MSVAISLDRKAVVRSENGSKIIPATLQIAARVARKYLRSPQLVILGTVQGALFLLIFRYVFGGAITLAHINYVNFVVPGFVTTGVLFTGMYATTGMAEDLSSGLIARLRSLPMPRSAVLLGRSIADTGMQVWSLGITIAIGFLVGFRLHATGGAVIESAGLLILFGFVFEWAFILMGLLAGSAQAAQGFALITFPITFISSAYVPVASMPSWLQGFAQNQPMTMMVDSVRTLTEGAPAEALVGHPASYFVVRSLIWSAGLIAVFITLAVARYRRG
jgi:ABC-2 type transport system permease protein